MDQRCETCGEIKPFEKFSLLGKLEKGERKKICYRCEYYRRKEKKDSIKPVKQSADLTKFKCVVCGHKSTTVEVHEFNTVSTIAPVCKKCKETIAFLKSFHYIKNKKGFENFFIMAEQFPILLTYLPPNDITPLIDFIESRDNENLKH